MGALSHLCNAVMLQLDDSGHSHLHAPEDGHHFQDLVVERRGTEDLHGTVTTIR